MYIQKLYALNFKNYEELQLEFDPRLNVFLGKNGSGKTNLLDAIYYLSLTKSAFSSDANLVKKGQNFFMMKGSFRNAEEESEVSSSVQTGAKKLFRHNQIDYDRLSTHIGKYPVVLIAPDDTELVKEGSETRRKFFDGILCQLDSRYLEDLIAYNHALRQRNSLLKMFFEMSRRDVVALQVYDDQLAKYGSYIYNRRKDFIMEFAPFFHHYFSDIVQQGEQTNIHYNTLLHEQSFEDGLRQNQSRDLVSLRTNFGIHRDDFDFRLSGGDLKTLGSQGQQKSFVIALKLAQHKILEQYKGFKPILLLDDIFDKLDDERITRLLLLLKSEVGQVFITDARPHRTEELLNNFDVSAKIFLIDRGTVTSRLPD